MILFNNKTRDELEIAIGKDDNDNEELPTLPFLQDYSVSYEDFYNAGEHNTIHNKTTNAFMTEISLEKMKIFETPEEYAKSNKVYRISVLSCRHGKGMLQISHAEDGKPEEFEVCEDHKMIVMEVIGKFVKNHPLIHRFTHTKLWNLLTLLEGDTRTPEEKAMAELAVIQDQIYPSSAVSSEEEDTLRKRLEKISDYFKRNYNIDADSDPATARKIALTFTGGGMRALMVTVSGLDLMKKEGVLDITSYITCLSGSTWAMAPWMLRSGEDWNVFYPDSDVDYFKYGNTVPEGLEPDPSNITHSSIFSVLAHIADHRGSLFEHPTLTHLWGLLVGGGLLKKRNKHDFHMTDYTIDNLKKAIQDGDNPIPIFTCCFNKEDYFGHGGEDTEPLVIEMGDNDHSNKVGWIQMTPFTCGSDLFGNIIDTTRFGNLCEPIPLYRLLGIWGSAFTISKEDVLTPPLLRKFVDLVEKIYGLEDDDHTFRDFAEKAFNYAPDKDGNGKDSLELRDGGLRDNVPLYPLFRENRRKCNLSIVFDASAGMDTSGCIDMKYAVQESILANYQDEVQKINKDQIKVRVIRSPDGHVVYFPVDMCCEMVKGRYRTIRLNYKKEEFDDLYKIVKDLVYSEYTYQDRGKEVKRTGIEIIKNEINEVMTNGLTKEPEVIEIDIPFKFPNHWSQETEDNVSGDNDPEVHVPGQKDGSKQVSKRSMKTYFMIGTIVILACSFLYNFMR